MIKRTAFLIPSLFLSLLPRAFASDFPLAVSAAEISAAALDLPAAKPAPAAPVKDWTVMYFINGKNNLESSALMDMNQLELAGTTARVNIAVELGRMNGQPEGDDHREGDWTGVRRYLVTRDADTSRITSPVLQDLGKADMGSWKELVSFINWSKTNFPARRYALVLWDHGNGWKPLDPANAHDFGNLKGFSLDDETGHEFSTPQLAAALKAVGGVNFLMLDGCNMQMASVAYELKDYAEALTASEDLEPGVVVRYAQYHAQLDARPSMGAEEFAVNAVRAYRDYFVSSGGDNEGGPATQSALRLSKMTAFREKLDLWAAAALKAEPAVLRHARLKARTFGEDPEYKDLYGFLELVTAGTADPRLKTLGREVMRFMKSELILENWAEDTVSHGLSIYIPEAYDPLYDKLAFSRDGRWDEFARFMAGLK